MSNTARAAEIAAISLTDPEQISKLPWVGNYAADAHLFDKCDAFAHTLSNREQRRRAVYLTTLHGMGIDEPISDEGLDFFDRH